MNSAEKKLLNIYSRLSDSGKKLACEYMEFLESKYTVEDNIPKIPLKIEKTGNETVVLAIKRLKKTYPMLESTSLLNKTSEILTSHLLKGKSKDEAIKELESYFEEEYKKFIENFS